MQMVVALYDCEGEMDQELTFKAFDELEVIDSSDQDWWIGKLNGRVGWFPTNYIY